MKRKRKLLVCVPIRPRGHIQSELVAWMIAVSVEAECKRVLDVLTADMDVFSRTKREIDKCREMIGGAWMTRLAMFMWSSKDAVDSMRVELIPEGWDVHVAYHGEQPIAANRNSICRKSLYVPDYANVEGNGNTSLVATDYDAVLQIDSDVVPGPHDLRFICEDLEGDEGRAGIVSGVYHMVNDYGRPIPVVYEATSEGTWRDRPGKSANLLLVEGPPLRTGAGIGVPGGFLAVRREVLIEMSNAGRVWFKDRFADGSLETWEIEEALKDGEKDPAAALAALRTLHEAVKAKEWGGGEPGSWALGEDLWFCRQAQEIGFEVWIDRRIVLSHYKDCDQRRVHGALELAHLEGYCRGLGKDPNDPEQFKAAREAQRAMLSEQAKARDAEMRAIANARKTGLRLVKETA